MSGPWSSLEVDSHMQVTCKSHAGHMQVTCRSHASHMQVTCRSHASHMLVCCRLPPATPAPTSCDWCPPPQQSVLPPGFAAHTVLCVSKSGTCGVSRLGEKGRGGLASCSHLPFSSNFVSMSQNKTAGWLHETSRGEWRVGDGGRVLHDISASLLAGTPPTGFTPLPV